MSPSPDLSSYVDLTLYDRDPTELVNRALLDAQVKLPGWLPQEGNVEVTLIEALALQVSELVYAINRITGATTEILLQLFGIFRNPGSPPTASVTFTLGDTLGHTVPAGTRIRVDLGSGNFEVFTTDAALVVASGSNSGTMTITGQDNTDTANGVTAGTTVTVVDAVLFVDSAVLATNVAGGVPPEGDQDWLDRGTAILSTLVDTLVLPSHFVAAAPKLDPNVYRVQAVDQWDPTLSGGAGGASNGNITVAVLGQGNTAITSGEMTTLAAALAAQAQSNLNVHVVAPTVTAVNVTATVQAMTGFTDAEVQANVLAALNAFLNTDTWNWSGTARVTDIISTIRGALGVAYVTSVTVPAADVTLPGVAPLATAGTLTITVTGP